MLTPPRVVAHNFVLFAAVYTKLIEFRACWLCRYRHIQGDPISDALIVLTVRCYIPVTMVRQCARYKMTIEEFRKNYRTDFWFDKRQSCSRYWTADFYSNIYFYRHKRYNVKRKQSFVSPIQGFNEYSNLHILYIFPYRTHSVASLRFSEYVRYRKRSTLVVIFAYVPFLTKQTFTYAVSLYVRL